MHRNSETENCFDYQCFETQTDEFFDSNLDEVLNFIKSRTLRNPHVDIIFLDETTTSLSVILQKRHSLSKKENHRKTYRQ